MNLIAPECIQTYTLCHTGDCTSVNQLFYALSCSDKAFGLLVLGLVAIFIIVEGGLFIYRRKYGSTN